MRFRHACDGQATDLRGAMFEWQLAGHLHDDLSTLHIHLAITSLQSVGKPCVDRDGDGQAEMKTRPHQSLLVACHGSVTLEFALVGGFFLMLILFITQASLILWAKAAMQESASRTARCTAIASSYCTDPTTYANSILNDWGVSGIVPKVNISVTPGATCNNLSGRFSMVKIDSTGSPFSGFVAPLSSIILSSSACYPSGT